MSQFKMIRACIYVLVAVGWLTFLGGIILAAALFVKNNWAIQLGWPLVYNSPITTGFAVLLIASLLAIMLLAGAELLVLWLTMYDDTKKIREFFNKK